MDVELLCSAEVGLLRGYVHAGEIGEPKLAEHQQKRTRAASDLEYLGRAIGWKVPHEVALVMVDRAA
jgi:hypothetical protein